MPDFKEVQTGSKAESVFNSGTDRFRTNTYRQDNGNPGPQDYNVSGKDPQYIIKGPVDPKFGTLAMRTSMLNRDVSKSPFKNPTNLENPSPSQYVTNQHELGKEFAEQAKFGGSPQQMLLAQRQSSSGSLPMDLDQYAPSKIQPNFKSSVGRDFLESVSKEIRQNPGPGSYLHDQLMKDKMKALSFQVCQRYQMNPFGTGNARFEYQKQPRKRNELTTDMNNGMISVKDKDVMEKRYAFQKTIELHKKMQDMQPNAIFKSSVQRECSPDRLGPTLCGDRDLDSSANQTMRSEAFKATAASRQPPSIGNEPRSSFGLFNESQSPYETGFTQRQGQDPGYAVPMHEMKKKPGFNATQPRFNYFKDHLRMQEVPGPGSYTRNHTQEGL